jgi:hypothetical protein
LLVLVLVVRLLLHRQNASILHWMGQGQRRAQREGAKTMLILVLVLVLELVLAYSLVVAMHIGMCMKMVGRRTVLGREITQTGFIRPQTRLLGRRHQAPLTPTTPCIPLTHQVQQQHRTVVPLWWHALLLHGCGHSQKRRGRGRGTPTSALRLCPLPPSLPLPK